MKKIYLCLVFVLASCSPAFAQLSERDIKELQKNPEFYDVITSTSVVVSPKPITPKPMVIGMAQPIQQSCYKPRRFFKRRIR